MGKRFKAKVIAPGPYQNDVGEFLYLNFENCNWVYHVRLDDRQIYHFLEHEIQIIKE